MKRFISNFLVLCLLISPLLLISCNPDNGDSTGTGDDSAVSEREPVVIAAGTEPFYKLIRYENADDDEVDAFMYLRKNLRDTYGVDMELSIDWYKPGSEPDPDAFEIVVGDTNREATSDTIEYYNMGYGDYAVRVCEHNKIVLVSTDHAKLNDAVEYFLSNVKTETDAESGTVNLVYVGGDYINRAAEKYIFNNHSLDEYTIVYSSSSGCLPSANELAKAIKNKYGVDLEVIEESDGSSDYEIIVGDLKTKKREVIDMSKLLDYEYVIATSETKIAIGGENRYLTDMAIDAFIKKHVSGISYRYLNLPTNISEIVNSCTGGESTELVDGADTRIMSFNILSEEWDSAAVFEGRDFRVSGIIMNYHPDVAALQEVSANWYPILERGIGGTYKCVRKTIPSGSYTYTTLWYNSQTTELLENGIDLFDVGNSQRLRSVVWGLFRSISTGEKYVVCSTHWDAGSDKDAVRLKQANEMAGIVTSLKSKYNVPVFVCGDYNSKESTPAYKAYISNSGFLSSKTTAEIINRDCVTYHTLGASMSTARAESIDHITYSPGAKVKYYNTLVSDYVLKASDHCPIYIDITLAK